MPTKMKPMGATIFNQLNHSEMTTFPNKSNGTGYTAKV